MVQGALRSLPATLELTPILRGVFTAMVEELQTLRRREQQQTLALNHLRAQVAEVAQLQCGLLPARLPTVAGLSIHTLYRPAETVSGDWYDVVRLDHRRTAFLLADATGHGLPAGMLSTLTRRCFQLDAATHDPAAILQNANREVLRLTLSDCQFVGAMLGIFDETSRVFTFARAGLPYPVLVTCGQTRRQFRGGGPALGTLEDANFDNFEIRLEPADRVILHTDGLDGLFPESDSSAAWAGGVGGISVESQFHDLDNRISHARSTSRELDDVTVLALEATPA
jgi:serine phosphatase RsbU (regulator of sigma subunit)